MKNVLLIITDPNKVQLTLKTYKFEGPIRLLLDYIRMHPNVTETSKVTRREE